MEEIMLTTVDNPYDPFTEYDQWYEYDMEKGYNTCAYLANNVETSNAFSDEENEQLIANAIDDIVRNKSFGIYMKAIKGKINGTSHLKKNEKEVN